MSDQKLSLDLEATSLRASHLREGWGKGEGWAQGVPGRSITALHEIPNRDVGRLSA